jgi:LysM repeat protein
VLVVLVVPVVRRRLTVRLDRQVLVLRAATPVVVAVVQQRLAVQRVPLAQAVRLVLLVRRTLAVTPAVQGLPVALPLRVSGATPAALAVVVTVVMPPPVSAAVEPVVVVLVVVAVVVLQRLVQRTVVPVAVVAQAAWLLVRTLYKPQVLATRQVLTLATL